MKIKPIYTEKSLKQAQNGVYSFWVLPEFSKYQITAFLKKTFAVEVADIKTLNYKKLTSRTNRGKTKTTKAMKKVLIKLKSGKLDWYEEEKSKKKK